MSRLALSDDDNTGEPPRCMLKKNKFETSSFAWAADVAKFEHEQTKQEPSPRSEHNHDENPSKVKEESEEISGSNESLEDDFSNIRLDAPVSRTARDGPPVAIQNIVGSVTSINPIIEELRHCIDLAEKNDKSLKVFDVKDCKSFGETYALAFCAALEKNTNIEELEISGVGMSNNVAIELAKALMKNTSVKVVNLERNNITALAVFNKSKNRCGNSQGLYDIITQLRS